MKKRVMLLVGIMLIYALTLQANREPVYKGFTVTQIALDAAMQADEIFYEEESNNTTEKTKLEGGIADKK